MEGLFLTLVLHCQLHHHHQTFHHLEIWVDVADVDVIVVDVDEVFNFAVDKNVTANFSHDLVVKSFRPDSLSFKKFFELLPS